MAERTRAMGEATQKCQCCGDRVLSALAVAEFCSSDCRTRAAQIDAQCAVLYGEAKRFQLVRN
jgi:hypothetical protein